MKKKIGISFSKTNFSYYWDWFTRDDLQDEMELVELSFVKNNVDDIAKCDGFILSGGVDIDPAFYHGNINYNKKPEEFQTSRDEFEKKIFEHANEKKLPVLGICRGLQMVNVALGGNLVQDLGEAGNKIHCKEDQDKRHTVTVQPNTLLHDISDVDVGEVNSAHHQSIGKLADGLKTNARSGDGVIEGFEWSDKSNKGFLLCVQWHPERMYKMQLENSPLSKKIKDRFIDEVQKKKT